jgi:uncharacterized protein YutE (UPF0331/DUF86 family)
MVDAERLRALLDRLRDAETELWRLRELGRDEVRGDTDRLNSTKYLFILAAEVAIDAGQHVIASEGLRAPGTFAAVFEELGKQEWLGPELSTSLAAMARFRNLLVHGYANVDDDIVVDMLHGASLDDLALFRSTLSRLLAG